MSDCNCKTDGKRSWDVDGISIWIAYAEYHEDQNETEEKFDAKPLNGAEFWVYFRQTEGSLKLWVVWS